MSKHPKSKVSKKEDTKISPADALTKTGKSGDIELDEGELERVSGGVTQAWPNKYSGQSGGG